MGSKEPMLKRRTALCLQVISLSKVIIVPNDCSTRKIINMMILPSKYTKSASFSVVKTGLFVKSWTNNNFFLQSHCILPIYPFFKRALSMTVSSSLYKMSNSFESPLTTIALWNPYSHLNLIICTVHRTLTQLWNCRSIIIHSGHLLVHVFAFSNTAL